MTKPIALKADRLDLRQPRIKILPDESRLSNEVAELLIQLDKGKIYLF